MKNEERNHTRLLLSGGISGNGTASLANDPNSMTVFLSGPNTMFGGTISVANNHTCVRFSTPLAGSPHADWVFKNVTANTEALDFGSGTIPFGSISGAGVIQGNVSAPIRRMVTMQIGGDSDSTLFSGVIHNNK